jgi:hypothetical protein
MSWISRIANVFRSKSVARDLEDELQFHLDQRANDLVGEGMPRGEAEFLARRQLSNSLQLRELSHDIKSATWLESLLRDCRFGFRMLNKYRTASLASISSLALAVGACTAAFALIDGLIFRPLPLPAPSQLIDIALVIPSFLSPGNQPRESDFFSFSQYELMRDTAHDRADLFAVSLSGGSNQRCLTTPAGRARTSAQTPYPAQALEFWAFSPF